MARFRGPPGGGGNRRTQCQQTEYRCELYDPETDTVVASDYAVIIAPKGTIRSTIYSRARRTILKRDRYANRRGGGYTTFEDARRRHPKLAIRCARAGQPFDVPGPC